MEQNLVLTHRSIGITTQKRQVKKKSLSFTQFTMCFLTSETPFFKFTKTMFLCVKTISFNGLKYK